MDPKLIFYVAFGLALLGLTWLPDLRGARFINVPFLYFLLAALLFSQSVGLPVVDPVDNADHALIAEYVTEIVVIVSLAGAGLAIDRTFRFRTWQTAMRLICVSMPLSIALAAVVGKFLLGLSWADAVLLGACLAPTDPVMAHSVQVGPPNRGGEDPVRFGLTTEAGLNDGLAFPFVYLALRLAEHGSTAGPWLWHWATYDFGLRVAMGILVGAGIGWLLAHYVFRFSDEATSDRTEEGLVVMAAIFLAYGIAELLHGYGFLAVFAAAVSGRQNFAKHHDYHQKPYQFATQLERILAALLLLLLGGFVATANVGLLSWPKLLFAGLFLLLIRPLSGWLSLWGLRSGRAERWAIAFLGIRGFGSFYYLAYAQNHGTFENISVLWSLVTLSVVLSLLIHGNSATLTIRWLDDKRKRWPPGSPGSPGSPSRVDESIEPRPPKL